MVRKLLLSLFVLVLIAPVFLATTPITVKTLAEHDVSIFVLEADKVYSLIESFHQNSGIEAQVSVTTTTEADKFDILVIIKKNNQKVFSERFEDYEEGQTIEIELPEREEPIVEEIEEIEEIAENSTENSTETPAEEVAEEQTQEVQETETSNSITGGVITTLTSKTGKIVYYILGAILIVGILSFVLVRRMRPSMKATSFPRPTIRTGNSDASPLNQSPKSGKLTEIENKIRDAQRELNTLKNEEKIKAAEEKL